MKKEKYNQKETDSNRLKETLLEVFREYYFAVDDHMSAIINDKVIGKTI